MGRAVGRTRTPQRRRPDNHRTDRSPHAAAIRAALVHGYRHAFTHGAAGLAAGTVTALLLLRSNSETPSGAAR